MAVAEQVPSAVIIASGDTTVFPYSFLVQNADDMVATVDDVEFPVGYYTITGLGQLSGGTVIFGSAPVQGARITLDRRTRLTRSTVFDDVGDFRAATLNADLDRPMLALQELRALVAAVQIGGVTEDGIVAALGFLPASNTDLTAAVAAAIAGGVTDKAPTVPADSAPPQGLSFAINSVVDVARMANNFASGGDDTAAMQKAVRYAAQNGGKLYLRGGLTARLGNLSLAGVREFSGDGPQASFIEPAGSLASFSALLTMSTDDAVLRDFTVSLDKTVYPTQRAIDLVNVSGLTLENITIPKAGAAGIRGDGCSNIDLDRVHVEGYVDIGITFVNSGYRIHIHRPRVLGTGNFHAISIAGGGLHEVVDWYCEGAKLFSVSGELCDGFYIGPGIGKDGHVEVVNVQDCQRWQIEGVKGYQRTDGAATDFGLSVFGTDGGPGCNNGRISGCFIFGSFKSGIALANKVQFVDVVGNYIRNSNQADEPQGSGILLYGAGVQRNNVWNNYIADESGKMRWQASEFNDGGAPSNNTIGPHRGVRGTLGQTKLVGSNSEAFDSEWVDFTATAVLTAAAGTLGAYTVTKALIKRQGKQAFVAVAFSAAPGSGSDAVLMAIPFMANTNGGTLIGSDDFNGNTVRAKAQGSFLTFRLANNTFPVVAGSLISASGDFELL